MDRTLKGLLCAAICAALLFTLPWPQTNVRAETGPQATQGEQLIVIPLRNATLDVLDREGVILNEMLYSLELMRHDAISVSVVPLMADKKDEPVDSVTLPEGLTRLQGVFANMVINRKLNTPAMKDAIGRSLDHALALVQSGCHATVVLLQAQAIDPSIADHPQWQKLKALVDTGNVDLVLLGVESKDMPDVTGFSRGMGFSQPPSSREGSLFASLDGHVRAALIPASRLESVYDLMVELIQGISSRSRLPLAKQEGYSSVTLPVRCVSNLLLALNDVPAEASIQITDGQGNALPFTQEQQSIRQQRLLRVESAGGEIHVMASGSSAQASSQPSQAVEGTALFDFACDAALTLIPPTAAPLYKKQSVHIGAEMSGQELAQVLQTYPGAKAELVVTDPAGSETVLPLSPDSLQPMLFTADTAFEHAGTYLVKARALVGDFYRLESGQESLAVSNHPPLGADQSAVLWTDDPFGQLKLAPYPLGALFTDGDGDVLRFGITFSGVADFGGGMTAEGFGRLSVAGAQLLMAPTATSGQVSLDVLATDEDGEPAKARLNLALFSLYRELDLISLEVPVIGAGSIGPNESVHLKKGEETVLTVRPVYQGAADYIPMEVFLARASVYCEVVNLLDASAEPVRLPMAYDAQVGVYRCDLKMENKEQRLAATAVAALTGVSPSYQELAYRSQAVTLETSNLAPQWIAQKGAAQEDAGEKALALGVQRLTGSGAGKEQYTLQLTLHEMFRDDDNTAAGDGQDIVYLLRAGEKKHGSCTLTVLADGRCLVSVPTEGALPVPAELRLEKTSAVTLVFETKGEYALDLAAVDPDEKEDHGVIRLRLISQLEERLMMAAIAVLAALALLGVILLVIRLMKPAFRQTALDVRVSSPAFQGEWTTRLDAWGKAKVSLDWVLLNGGVPPVEALYGIAKTTFMKPAGKGVQFVPGGKDSGWKRGRERLPGKFTQRADDPPITFALEDGTRIELMVRSTAGGAPADLGGSV